MVKYKIIGGSKYLFNTTADMLTAFINHMIDCESEIEHIEIFNLGHELHIKCYNEKSETRFVSYMNYSSNEHNFIKDHLTVMFNNCKKYRDLHNTETFVRIGRYVEDTHFEYYYDNLKQSVFVWNQILIDCCDLLDVLQYMAVL